jgi:hypothetical protein
MRGSKKPSIFRPRLVFLSSFKLMRGEAKIISDAIWSALLAHGILKTHKGAWAI